MSNKLNASIPANNWKIIELYNKLKNGELDPSPDFQRKLVWKRQHKYKFIETILLNFPFPEIYIAPGKLDITLLELKDVIVDGQQRCKTIESYIEGTDVFALSKINIKTFDKLTKEEKEDFLNYEVSIRYLKNANKEQIQDIFQKINSTEYALNSIERTNAQWGESEFVFFGKQITEPVDELDTENVNYKIDLSTRQYIYNFFVTEYFVFDENDVKRMLALQYILTLTATLIEGKYFRRNDRVQYYIQKYNEEFIGASTIDNALLLTTKYIASLGLSQNSYWFNKANVFSLIVELSKIDTSTIEVPKIVGELNSFELDYQDFIKAQSTSMPFTERFIGQTKYFEYAREGVNEVPAREYRGEIIRKIISNCLIPTGASVSEAHS